MYGVETALTTFTCMYDAMLWDPELVSFEQKTVLVGGLYGGYFALGKFWAFFLFLIPAFLLLCLIFLFPSCHEEIQLIWESQRSC